ncbi:arylsulfatase [bacterium]|nr:arylsulfatase [bacterium]
MTNLKTPPNVIFILTDDQGYGDLSCHGNPLLRTPAIDRLHAESVRFTDFHVAPVCTPTRGELMTGRDALCNGATFVCMGRSLLRAGLPTMADIFAANGYHTGHFGKWHLGDNYPYRPHDRGFHESVYHPGFGITSAPDYFGNDYMDDHYRHKDEIEEYKGYCTDVWFEQALDWMGGCRKRNEPFFAYIATNAPHGPLWVPNQFREPYLGRAKYHEASFFGMIACIDENVARLESFLHSSGLRENTILIFMTDNGTAVGEGVFNAGMRGKKASVYEGGHRVPFFIRWPQGGIGGGRDVQGMTRSTDVLPTLISLCGLRIDAGLAFDGVSLAGALRNGKEPVPDRMAVVQYGHSNEGVWGYTQEDMAAVLWRQWRLVNGCELYNIATDPGQTTDVAAAHPDIAARMRGHYGQWWAAHRRTLDEYQPLIIGSDRENPMRLCSPDWAWAYADNSSNMRGCVMESGTWHVDVAKQGMYEFTLRRWPEESGLGIAAPAPVMQGFDGTLPEGKALPVASAWLRVGNAEQTQPVREGADHVTFRLGLEAGVAQIRTWWFDAEGNRLAGAYYMTVERLRVS